MNTAEQAYESVIQAIENNRISDALDQLLAFAESFSPSRLAAVRMQRSEYKALEDEALMMGEGNSIRERRSSLKLQLFRLADAIKNEAGLAPIANTSPQSANPKGQKRLYDTTQLRAIFRSGQTGALIEELITLTDGDNNFHDHTLLLEQSWKAIREDEQYNTASPESISIRQNQLNKSLLELIREMEED